MTENNPMPEDRKQYLKEYRATNLKRVPLDLPFDFYERVKARADAEGKSVNGLIKSLLEKYLSWTDKK